MSYTLINGELNNVNNETNIIRQFNCKYAYINDKNISVEMYKNEYIPFNHSIYLFI